MTPEQKIFWRILKSDPKWFAHECVQELKDAGNDAALLNQRADVLIKQMLGVLTVQDITSVIKTWLATYHVALDATLLENFDSFHERVGSYVIDNAPAIQTIKKD